MISNAGDIGKYRNSFAASLAETWRVYGEHKINLRTSIKIETLDQEKRPRLTQTSSKVWFTLRWPVSAAQLGRGYVPVRLLPLPPLLLHTARGCSLGSTDILPFNNGASHLRSRAVVDLEISRIS